MLLSSRWYYLTSRSRSHTPPERPSPEARLSECAMHLDHVRALFITMWSLQKEFVRGKRGLSPSREAAKRAIEGQFQDAVNARQPMTVITRGASNWMRSRSGTLC